MKDSCNPEAAIVVVLNVPVCFVPFMCDRYKEIGNIY